MGENRASIIHADCTNVLRNFVHKIDIVFVTFSAPSNISTYLKRLCPTRKNRVTICVSANVTNALSLPLPQNKMVSYRLKRLRRNPRTQPSVAPVRPDHAAITQFGHLLLDFVVNAQCILHLGVSLSNSVDTHKFVQCLDETCFSVNSISAVAITDYAKSNAFVDKLCTKAKPPAPLAMTNEQTTTPDAPRVSRNATSPLRFIFLDATKSTCTSSYHHCSVR